MAKSGAAVESGTFLVARRLFLRALAAIFAIAFVSLWLQVDGLLGSRGVLPAERLAEAIPNGVSGFWYAPSLFWLHPSDEMLHALCAGGLLVSVSALAGYIESLSLALAWAFYLSLVTIGQDFMSFQWDMLLLEAGVLGAIWASEAWTGGLWLVRWLLFRLMFLSGCVKLLSGDPHWRDLSALSLHFETQPLPTWIGWYAYQLPGAALRAATLSMFVIELGAPWLIFAPRRARLAGAALLVLLQLLIAATGNYCFFNLLTIALCLALIDDATFARIMPRAWHDRLSRPAPRAGARSARSNPMLGTWRRHRVGEKLRWIAAILIVACTTSELAGTFGARLGPLATLASVVSPLRSTNSYGLFAVMTTERDEIVLEGSRDGKAWRAYEFEWKPGAVDRRPGFVAPYQPRLDWQMWFAALGDYRENPWLINLMVRLLQGSPPVIGLLKTNPFADATPNFIRAVVYQYRFTSLAERRANGAWWTREYKGLYAPILSKRG